jgi:hypothetical protein
MIGSDYEHKPGDLIKVTPYGYMMHVVGVIIDVSFNDYTILCCGDVSNTVWNVQVHYVNAIHT